MRRIQVGPGRTSIAVEHGSELRDLALPVEPDPAAAAVATAGLWRLQWVQLHLDGDAAVARLAGTTRHPHVRTIPAAAALALAEQGVPAYVVEQG